MRLWATKGPSSRVVTGLLTGHNTLRRHLHLIGLLDSPLCRRCGAKEETSAHIFVNVRFWPHPDTRIWAPSSRQRIFRI